MENYDHDVINILYKRLETIDNKIDRVLENMSKKISWTSLLSLLGLLLLIVGGIISHNYLADAKQWEKISNNKELIIQNQSNYKGLQNALDKNR